MGLATSGTPASVAAISRSKKMEILHNERLGFIPDDHRITKTPILNGLHHEYRLERIAAMMLPSNQGGSIYCVAQGHSHRIHQIVNTNSVGVVNGPEFHLDAHSVIVRRQLSNSEVLSEAHKCLSEL